MDRKNYGKIIDNIWNILTEHYAERILIRTHVGCNKFMNYIEMF